MRQKVNRNSFFMSHDLEDTQHKAQDRVFEWYFEICAVLSALNLLTVICKLEAFIKLGLRFAVNYRDTTTRGTIVLVFYWTMLPDRVQYWRRGKLARTVHQL